MYIGRIAAAVAVLLISASASAVPIRLDFVGIDWFQPEDVITGYLEFDTDEGVETFGWFPSGNYLFEGGSTVIYVERSDGRTAIADTFKLSFVNDQVSRPVFCGDDPVTWDGLWLDSPDLLFNILDCSAQMFGPEVATLEDAVANPLATGDGLFQWDLRQGPGIGQGFTLLSLSTPIVTLFQALTLPPEPEPTIVPEPSLLLLLGTGLAVTLIFSRKRAGPRGGRARPRNGEARAGRALSEAATFSGGTFPLLLISGILGRKSCAVNTLRFPGQESQCTRPRR